MKTRDLHLYKKLHEKDAGYGSNTSHHFNKISAFIQKHQPKTILDFGCGKASLEKLIMQDHKDVVVDSYDPAIVEREIISKSSYDMIVSTDVLEHLFEDEIKGIFEEMLLLQPISMYHVICHRLAYQILEDGTNAHKCVQPPEWWADVIADIAVGYNVSYTNQGHEAGFFEIVRN